MSNEIQPAVRQDIVSTLDNVCNDVVQLTTVQKFERAFKLATAIQMLVSSLTDDVMQPIMMLQGSAIGFRTDKDKSGGYDLVTVRNCLIDAVIAGVSPVGNEFNIISGKTYITKEGMGRLLRSIDGLRYVITPGVPQIKGDTAIVTMTIEWRLNGGDSTKRDIEFSVRLNSGMGADAAIGKATRKARAWLYAMVTGMELSDGDITDKQSAAPTVIDVKAEKPRLADIVKKKTAAKPVDPCKESAKVYFTNAANSAVSYERFVAIVNEIWNDTDSGKAPADAREELFWIVYDIAKTKGVELPVPEGVEL